MDIGIVGYGVVGKSVCAAFKDRVQLHIYDPAYPQNSEEFEDSLDGVWLKSEFIFVCVPTPQKTEPGTYGGPFDGTIVDHCMEVLGKQADDASKIVVLTSTTLPSRILEYQKKWSHLRLVVCPEFLRQNTALQDYLNPKFRILGGSGEDTKAVQELFEKFSVCTPCPVEFCDAPGASLVKYMNNTFLATKVSILNQFYELWEKSGSTAEWSQLMRALHLDERLGNSHHQIPGPDGDRGWGGKCYPKDANALLAEAENMGVSLSVLEEAWKYNLSIRKNFDWMDN